MLVILLQDWVISVMSILPLPISTIEDKDATDYANCYVDETDDENVTDDESDKYDDECTLSADGRDEIDDDDDKTSNDALSVVVLNEMLDVLCEFI